MITAYLLCSSFFSPLFPHSFICSSVSYLTPSLTSSHIYKQLELLRVQRSLVARRDLLDKACLSHTRKRQVLSTEDLKHLIVDDRHGLIYCYVPKVGC